MSVESQGTKFVTPPWASEMTAVTASRYGSSDVLRVERVARPAIAPTEVLIKVHAAGLDRGAWHLMTGRPYLMRLMGFGLRALKEPVLGHDVAGEVVAVGADVTRFAVGDEVFGIGRGSFAEYTAASQDKLAKKPANATFEQAAATATSALTALQGLRDAGRLRAGQTVLVTGASGGVGSFAVQLATALGAEVTGVASTAKIDFVRGLGAVAVVDYTAADVADGARTYDVVLDLAGNTPLRRLRRAVSPTGTAVIAGGEGGDALTGGIDRQFRGALLSRFISPRFTFVICKETHTDLEVLAGMLADGSVAPAIHRTYPLHRAVEAMQELEAGRIRGKVVITVEQQPRV